MNVGQIVQFYYTGAGLTYVDIPTAPTFSSAATITDSVGSSLESGELSGLTDVLISNPFAQRLRPNGLVGSSGTPYRFKSVSDSTRSWIGGSVLTAGQQVITSLNNSNFCYFYHLGIQGDPDDTVSGISGIAWNTVAAGAEMVFEDIVIKDVEFAGAQINNANANDYENLTMKFLRVFGHNVEGEGLYLGSTATSGYSVFNNTTLHHIFLTDKGRDGLQLNNHGNLDVQGLTVYDVGKDNIAGQNRLLQVQNCNGTLKNGILDGAPELADIFAHGITIEGYYFRWDTDDDAFWGKLTSSYTGSPYETNTTVTFRNCIFDPSVTQTGPLIDIREDECNIVFENCLKGPNASSVAIYTDNRADKVTYSLSESGTSTYSGGAPTYQSVNEDDESTHGLLTNSTLHGLGYGYRTQAVS